MTRGIQSGSKIPVVLFGAGNDKIAVDGSGAIVTASIVHYQIHQGTLFTASYISANASPIADDGNIDMLLVTDSTTVHLIFEIAAGGNAEIALYEGTTTSDDGTALAEVNAKRSGGNVATLVATHTPTVSGVGTRLLSEFQAGGTGGNATGGGGFGPREWILAGSTKYLIRGTNRAGTSQPMSIVAQWYEV